MLDSAPSDCVAFRNDFAVDFLGSGVRAADRLRGETAQQRHQHHPQWLAEAAARAHVAKARAHPPARCPLDLRSADLTTLVSQTHKFDVLLVNPPWRAGAPAGARSWSIAELKKLPVPKLLSQPGIVFLRCDELNLRDAHSLLSHWNCELVDTLVCVPAAAATGAGAPRAAAEAVAAFCQPPALHAAERETLRLRRALNWLETRCVTPAPTPVSRSATYCLVGLRACKQPEMFGLAFHAGLDINVLLTPLSSARDPLRGTLPLPEELFAVIGRLCKGRRKLLLFAAPDCARAGWLSVSDETGPVSPSYDTYVSWFQPLHIEKKSDGSLSRLQFYTKNSFPHVKSFCGGRFEGSVPPKLFSARP